MNLYKRINKYTLEHHPIAWNTHIIWMILSGILFNIIFFGLGFLATNLQLLKEHKFNNYFFRSPFFLLFIVSALIIAILWLIKVYKNNPIKSFYKVKWSYLFIVFFHFCIIIFLHSMVYYSFSKGKNIKATMILNRDELIADAHIMNMAYPFFLSTENNYKLEERQYPNPFPLNNLVGNQLYDTIQKRAYVYMVDKTKPYLEFNDRFYQYGEVEEKIVNCDLVSYLDTIYDIPKTYGLKEYSIYNFSSLFTSYYSYSPSKYSYKENIAPYVHQILLDKNSTKIKTILDSAKYVCTKYGIENRINTNDLAAISIKDSIWSNIIVSVERENDEPNLTNHYYSVDLYNNHNKVNYLDKNSLNNIYNNYDDALHNSDNQQSFFWAVVFFSLISAYFLLLGKFATGINILLSAVIAGVLLIAFGLLAFLIMNGSETQRNLTIFATCYSGIVILIGYIAIRNTSVAKWFRDKLALITYVSIPTFFCFLWSNFYPKGYEIPGKGCEPDQYISPSFTMEPWHFVIAGLLSIIPAFLLIRKWLSKPE